MSDGSAAGRDTRALTRKRRCGLTVTRTFLTFFFSWKSRAEQTVVLIDTEGSFVPSTVQSAGVLVCNLLHRLLNLLHDGAVQHLQLAGRPADGAHRVALQPRRDLRNLLRPVCAAVKWINNLLKFFGFYFTNLTKFSHTFWECPVVSKSWSHVNSVLGDVRDICFVPNPGFCLLNDNSGINLKQIQVEMVFEIILDP